MRFQEADEAERQRMVKTLSGGPRKNSHRRRRRSIKGKAVQAPQA
jgi:hypothetical protein